MRNKYQRISSEQVEFIKASTLSGSSLRQLAQTMGLGITSIYYQVRKFKPKGRKEFQVNINEFNIGELIGAFAGDGSYTNYLTDREDVSRGKQHRVRYHLSLKTDASYAEYIKCLLIKMNLNPHLYTRVDYNAIDVAVSSKPFLDFIKNYLVWEKDKTYSIRLKRKLEDYSDDFLKGFARGLMDTDGYLNLGNATCACISERLINNLAEIFTRFGINFTRNVLNKGGNRRPLFYIRVLRKSLEGYERNVGFSNECKSIALGTILKKN